MFFIVTVTNRIPVFFSGKPNKYRFGEQSLGPKRREAKATQIESIQRKLLGDSIIKNIERFAPKYFTLFPASTVLNAGIPGDTVEAMLYRVLHMSFPLTVTCISLLCGTNNLSSHSPATISVPWVPEVLFFFREERAVKRRGEVARYLIDHAKGKKNPLAPRVPSLQL